jgi:hypothetical protein
MGLKERAEISVGGPDGGSTWGDEGDGFTLQNHATVTATTTANILPMQTITRPNTVLAGGLSAPDQLQAGVGIQTLYGCQVSSPAGQAAFTNLSMTVGVYRNIGLGVALASGVAITQLTLASPLVSPMPSGQTIALTSPSGSTTTATLSAAAIVGQQVVFINSLTPGAAYSTASYAIILVGNAQAFGWLASGTGTPLFPVNSNLVMPALTNTAIVNGGLTLSPGDSICCTLVTASSTAVCAVSNLQPLIV